MDIAINNLLRHYEIALDQLYNEWITQEYKKLSECPSFETCNIYRKAIKLMSDWFFEEKSRSSVKEDLKNYVSAFRGIEIKL